MHKKVGRVNTRREPIRAHQGRTVAGGNAAKPKEGTVSLSPTQNSGENSGSPRGRVENLKPWPKGVSGNPGGRPRRQPLTEAYLKLATQRVPGDHRGRTYADLTAERQFKAALKGSTAAAREIGDRLEGKPQQRIEMTRDDDLFAGRTVEELECFALHGYWPNDNVGGE